MKYFFFFLSIFSYSQSITLNEDFINDHIRNEQLLGNLSSDISLTIRPVETYFLEKENSIYGSKILSNSSESIIFKILPINTNVEFNSKHPYNRNNGTMVPNRGLQSLISTGLFIKLGPLSIQLKPEYHHAENRQFDGFWEGHYPEIWAERYRLWNKIDMPERHGDKSLSRFLIGQSNIKLNYKKLSLGISNENIWWGPSIRNSIMMSNHARGFKHITFNTREPIKTIIGNFEWQIVTGRLEASGYKPPNPDYKYAGTNLWVPKINQIWEVDDWRFFQGYIVKFSPKFLPNFHLGLIRWVQMYSALLEGRYEWFEGSTNFFPAFSNLFRKNDTVGDYEGHTDQAGGLFFRWVWDDSNAEIYAEYHYNDSKHNFRDLILDSDHSRAATIGLQKIFVLNDKNFKFSWEWTQMEQTAGRLLRNAKSWYEHDWIYHGFTNYGEVIGSSIGPGSNSHYFSFSKINKLKSYGISFEIIDNDNDFYHDAFASAQDPRRFWKDFNLHLNFNQKFNKTWINANFIFSRSLNYQWELNDLTTPYFHPGKDVNNFHFSIKMLRSIF